RKTLPVKSSQTSVIIVRRPAQGIQSRAFEHAGTLVADNGSSETDSAHPVPENRMDPVQAVALVVSNKAVAFKFHHPGVARSQPQVAAKVFVKRRDVMLGQPVFFGI